MKKVKTGAKMKNFAVICEYNPFHFGHEYHISELKSQGANVICVMSGDFCQRGECAVADKYVRARAALAGGADLVLELPFPYSAAGAEKFAFGAVDIINRLGFPIELSFGSECGNADMIFDTAKNTLSPEFESALSQNLVNNSDKPFASVYFDTYREVFDEDGVFTGSNNILGVAYASQIVKRGFDIPISTIKREGQSFGGDGAGFASATYIREKLFLGESHLLKNLMPEYSYKLLYSELEAGRCSYPEKMFPIFASFLRTHTADDIANFAENDVSLASRLIKAGNESTCMRELYEFAITKKYSASRVRRALLFSYFGVTQEMLLDPPSYTTLLAANKRGCELLAEARKKADIPIITKPSDYEKYGEKVKSAFEFAKKAAAVRLLTQEKVQSTADLVRKTPYIEK